MVTENLNLKDKCRPSFFNFISEIERNIHAQYMSEYSLTKRLPKLTYGSCNHKITTQNELISVLIIFLNEAEIDKIIILNLQILFYLLLNNSNKNNLYSFELKFNVIKKIIVAENKI